MTRYDYQIIPYFIFSFFACPLILSSESQAGQLRYSTREASYQGEGINVHCYANGACTSSYSMPGGGGSGSGGYQNSAAQMQQQLAEAGHAMQAGAEIVDTIGDIRQISKDRAEQRQKFEQTEREMDARETDLEQEYNEVIQAEDEAESQEQIEEKNQEEEQKHEDVMNLIQGDTDSELPEEAGNQATTDQATNRLPTIEEEKLAQLPENSDFKIVTGGISGSQSDSSYEVKPSTAFFGIPGNPNVAVKPDLANQSTSTVNTNTKFVVPRAAPIVPAAAPEISAQAEQTVYSQFTPDQAKAPQQNQGTFFQSVGDLYQSLYKPDTKKNPALIKRLMLQYALAKASDKKEINKKGECNFFVSEVGRILDIPYFRRFGYHKNDDKRMANQMYSFLEKAGKDPKSGWEIVDAKDATKLANEGEFVVAAAKNKYAPDEISGGGTRVDSFDKKGEEIAHGHIGIVAPDSMKVNLEANKGSLPLIRDSAHPHESVRANYTFSSLSGKADPKTVEIGKPIYVHWKGTTN